MSKPPTQKPCGSPSSLVEANKLGPVLHVDSQMTGLPPSFAMADRPLCLWRVKCEKRQMVLDLGPWGVCVTDGLSECLRPDPRDTRHATYCRIHPIYHCTEATQASRPFVLNSAHQKIRSCVVAENLGALSNSMPCDIPRVVLA